METLKDIKNKNFRSVLLRHEIDDLSDMVETSSDLILMIWGIQQVQKRHALEFL